jgi:anti-sigma regulatory factor (Ser/Thr protein kinase)
MTHSATIGFELRRELPATQLDAEAFFVDFRQRCQASLNAVNSFAAELLVREAVINAVVHGCHTNSEKRVWCSLRLSDRRLLVVVEHDGDGFDWRAVARRGVKPLASSGRGIFILRKYADRVRYNERGSVVAIVKRFI